MLRIFFCVFCFSHWRRCRRVTRSPRCGGTDSSSTLKNTSAAQSPETISCRCHCGRCSGAAVWSTANWTRSDTPPPPPCWSGQWTWLPWVLLWPKGDGTIRCSTMFSFSRNRHLSVLFYLFFSFSVICVNMVHSCSFVLCPLIFATFSAFVADLWRLWTSSVVFHHFTKPQFIYCLKSVIQMAKMSQVFPFFFLNKMHFLTVLATTKCKKNMCIKLYF